MNPAGYPIIRPIMAAGALFVAHYADTLFLDHNRAPTMPGRPDTKSLSGDL